MSEQTDTTNQSAVYNNEPLDRCDCSGNVPSGSPVIYKDKGNADVSENSPKKAKAESKQEMETVYGQKADIVDSKWNSEILNAQFHMQLVTHIVSKRLCHLMTSLERNAWYLLLLSAIYPCLKL